LCSPPATGVKPVCDRQVAWRSATEATAFFPVQPLSAAAAEQIGCLGGPYERAMAASSGGPRRAMRKSPVGRGRLSARMTILPPAHPGRVRGSLLASAGLLARRSSRSSGLPGCPVACSDGARRSQLRGQLRSRALPRQEAGTHRIPFQSLAGTDISYWPRAWASGKHRPLQTLGKVRRWQESPRDRRNERSGACAPSATTAAAPQPRAAGVTPSRMSFAVLSINFPQGGRPAEGLCLSSGGQGAHRILHVTRLPG
jgi:hypothetical protein